MEYVIHLCILISIYLILTQSFNISFGLGLLFNLAHVASYAIGAYATALFATELGANFFECVVVSMLLSGLFSLLIGGISLRLEQDYFAVGTLAFSALVSALLINWKSLTRGVLGIPGIPRPEFLSIDFYNNLNFLFLSGSLAIFVLIILYLLFQTPFARALKAQAESESATKALACNTALICNVSFFISSAFAGLAGSLYAYYINYIDPSSFSLTEMVFILTITVTGRPGSFIGCILATFFLVLLPEPLRFIDMSPGILGPMRQALYATILFVVVYINRRNIFPVKRSV